MSVSYSIKPFDDQFSEFLADVEENWTVQANELNGPHSEALALAGRKPTAADLAHLMAGPMQDWSWISHRRNRRATTFALVKAQLLLRTVDDSIHVSEDGSTTAVWVVPNGVYVFRDESEGMREILYFKGKTSNNASEGTEETAPSAASSPPQD